MRKRTQARECALKILYQAELTRREIHTAAEIFWGEMEKIDPRVQTFTTRLTSGIEEHLQKIDDKNWIVDGKIDIEELNESLNLDIPTEEDYESLGGFIFSLMGRIPNEKEEIKYKHSRLIIEKVLRQRIKKVHIVQENQ